MEGSAGPAQLRIVGHDRVHWQCEVLGWCGGLYKPGMPLHGKWLGPGALGRSASIRAGIVWASFGASFKDCMLSPLPSISKNLTGQEFHGAAYHDPEDKTRRYNKQSYGRCQAWGHDFLGHRFGWGPHRFACLSHPCRVSGPFLINLIVLNSDGGSYILGNTLDASEMRRSPVEFDRFDSLSHYLQGFSTIGGWPWDF